MRFSQIFKTYFCGVRNENNIYTGFRDDRFIALVPFSSSSSHHCHHHQLTFIESILYGSKPISQKQGTSGNKNHSFRVQEDLLRNLLFQNITQYLVS